MQAVLDERRAASYAAAGSFLLHLVLFAGGVLWAALSRPVAPPSLLETEKPLEIVFVPPPETTPFMEAPAGVPERAPQKALFESDRSTVGAADRPASGDLPLPSQDGRSDPRPELRDSRLALGPSDRPPMPATAPPEQAPAADLPRPTPAPVAQGAGAVAPPKPAPTPTMRSEAPPRPETVARPAPPAYRPHQERTKVQGNISNRGISSVDAQGTPLGRYKKALSDAIGSRWYFLTNARMSLIQLGSVRIKFNVTREGEVEDLRLLSNSSNEIFATCSVQAVAEAELPPIPADVADALHENRLEVEYTFTIYSR